MNGIDSDDIRISTTPVRKVIRRSSAISNGTFRTYKHPSKAAAFVPGESNNELAFLRFAEMDPSVTLILAQPTVLEATHEGKIVFHVPDYAIRLSGRRTFVEAKGARAFADPKLRRRLDAFALAAARGGWDYLVVVGTDLMNSAAWRHVDSLWRSHRRIYDEAQLVAVTNLLHSRAMPIGEAVDILRASMADAAPEARHILSMAAGNRILIDVEQVTSVGTDSVVRLLTANNRPATFIPFVKPPFATEDAR